MDTLFPLSETLSPRLAWMQKHEVRTHDHGAPVECDITGEHSRWLAWTRTDEPDAMTPTGEGETEILAVDALTLKMGWEVCPA